MTNKKNTGVYVIATPIGNMDDLSPRAQKTLEEVDIIAAEDTRRTKKLLSHFQIKGKKIFSYYDHKEQNKAEKILQLVQDQDLSVGLVCDSGTPGISDPGYRLIRLARNLKIPVYPIPGPSAIATIISVSGLPSDRVTFVGFLPTQQSPLENEITSWANYNSSIIFLESAKRILSTLTVITKIYPNTEITIGREMTKEFEEIILTSTDEAVKWAESHSQLKGELTIMINVESKEHKERKKRELMDKLKLYSSQIRNSGLSQKELWDLFQFPEITKKEFYSLMLEIKNKRG